MKGSQQKGKSNARQVQNIEARFNKGCGLGRSASGNSEQTQGLQSCSSKAMVEFSLPPRLRCTQSPT